MMGEPINGGALTHHHKQSRDRRLRNRILIGNAITWIAILTLIHVIFF